MSGRSNRSADTAAKAYGVPESQGDLALACQDINERYSPAVGMDPVPKVADLLEIFDDLEPQDPEGVKYWPYATVTCRARRNDAELRVELSPGYGDMRITIHVDGQTMTDLKLEDVRSVTVERLSGRTALLLGFRNDRNLGLLALRIDPYISLGWTVGS